MIRLPLLLTAALLPTPALAELARRPNVVLILADDKEY
jgi:hypothetical protein